MKLGPEKTSEEIIRQVEAALRRLKKNTANGLPNGGHRELYRFLKKHYEVVWEFRGAISTLRNGVARKAESTIRKNGNIFSELIRLHHQPDVRTLSSWSLALREAFRNRIRPSELVHWLDSNGIKRLAQNSRKSVRRSKTTKKVQSTKKNAPPIARAPKQIHLGSSSPTRRAVPKTMPITPHKK